VFLFKLFGGCQRIQKYIKKCIKLVCFDVLRVKGENVMKWVLGFKRHFCVFVFHFSFFLKSIYVQFLKKKFTLLF